MSKEKPEPLLKTEKARPDTLAEYASRKALQREAAATLSSPPKREKIRAANW